MRELPILFNTEMVKAILGGRKTCTRRLVKFLPGKNPQWTGYIKDGLMLYNGKNEPCIKKAPYQPGDILYVRETWCSVGKDVKGNVGFLPGEQYLYKADDIGLAHIKRWHPSIHMPKEAARIWLKVTDVKVERLQEITEIQTQAEGCNSGLLTGPCSARGQFENLWNRTIKKSDLDIYGWKANPWVWVIEFERCEKPGKE